MELRSAAQEKMHTITSEAGCFIYICNMHKQGYCEGEITTRSRERRKEGFGMSVRCVCLCVCVCVRGGDGERVGGLWKIGVINI